MSLSIHASARYTNAIRSLMAYLVTSGISAAVVSVEDTRHSSDNGNFVRVSIKTFPEQSRGGHPAGGSAFEGRLQIDCECYARGTDGATIGQLNLADQLADEVSAALRLGDIPILDYVANAEIPLSAGATLQIHQPPTRIHPGRIEGWQRRIVSAEAFWFLRKE